MSGKPQRIDANANLLMSARLACLRTVIERFWIPACAGMATGEAYLCHITARVSPTEQQDSEILIRSEFRVLRQPSSNTNVSGRL